MADKLRAAIREHMSASEIHAAIGWLQYRECLDSIEAAALRASSGIASSVAWMREMQQEAERDQWRQQVTAFWHAQPPLTGRSDEVVVMEPGAISGRARRCRPPAKESGSASVARPETAYTSHMA